MEKRYQVFISSTFRDLKDEREAVVMGVLELNHFPAGMEVFPAADSTPWDLIRSIIAESDYYVLIVAGMYGSVDENGISYTEREYDLAVELGKPILSFLHGNPSEIPAGKTELTETTRQKLEEFRKKIQGRHCKYWTSKDDLRSKVILAMTHAIRTNPGIGWIRSDQFDNTPLLTRLNSLRDELDASRAECDRLRKQVTGHGPIEGVADESSPVKIPIRYAYGDTSEQKVPYKNTFEWEWGGIFYWLGARLLDGEYEETIRSVLARIIESKIRNTPLESEMHQEAEQFKIPSEERNQYLQVAPGFMYELRIQFMAWDALEVQRTINGNKWKLTPLGQRKYVARRAQPKCADTGDSPQ